MASAPTSSPLPASARPGYGEPLVALIDQFIEPQGMWSEDDYIAFDRPVLVEYDDGFIEVLPMPTTLHQEIVLFLLLALQPLAKATGGKALMAPLKVKTGTRQYREPDLLFVDGKHRDLVGNKFWRGANLVMEVVSPDNPDRDYDTKRKDYAAAGIAEYWIVDPQRLHITVLTLAGNEYVEAGAYKPGDTAASVLLTDLKIDVTTCFAAGQ